jgi:glutathione S-transferase
VKLYVLRTCPYCVRVLRWLEGRNLPVQIVEVPSAHSARVELRAVSGQTFVPTLVDGDVVIADDDDAILEYLKRKERANVA